MSKINQRLEQGQKLNPKQIIEANLMQMNLATLEKRILEEIESNPVLYIADDEQDYNDEDNTDDSDFNWEEQYIIGSYDESIGTGSTYGDTTIFGTKLGIGYKADVTDNMYIFFLYIYDIDIYL